MLMKIMQLKQTLLLLFAIKQLIYLALQNVDRNYDVKILFHRKFTDSFCKSTPAKSVFIFYFIGF